MCEDGYEYYDDNYKMAHVNRKRKCWKSTNKNEGCKFNIPVLKGWKIRGQKQKGYISWY